MSFAIPDADKYIAFSRIQDPSALTPGWVVVAVLEMECPAQVYLNNGQQGYGQQKSVDFLVGLPGTREQADLFRQMQDAKNDAAHVSLNFDEAKREWEKKEKKHMEDWDHSNRQLVSLKEQYDLRVGEKAAQAKEVERLKGEITRLKESISSVMLLVADNQRASVAEMMTAQKVGETLGEDHEKAR